MLLAPPARTRLLRMARVLLAAAALLLPAAWNGIPLLYPDTPTYLRGAETAAMRLAGPGRLAPWLPAPAEGASAQGTAAAGAPDEAGTRAPARRAEGLTSVGQQVVLAGRSVYYGALLEAAHLAGSLWWAAMFQALCVAWLLHLVVVDAWRLPTGVFLPMAAGLAWGTPLGLYTGLLMPDVFAGLAVLATAALIAHGRALRAGQRLALGALLLFALCAHASHLALVGALLVLALGWSWRTRRQATGAATHALSAAGPWRPGMATVAACLALAVLAEAAFARAVERALGAPPLRLPHLTARLVDQGPGTDYLRAHCPSLPPAQRWAACAYLDRYPLAWTDFLFATEPGRAVFADADAATKRRLSQEQVALAWQVLRHDPAGVLGGVAADLPRQLLGFKVDIWGLGPRELAMYEGRVPPAWMDAMRRSQGATAPQLQQVFSAITMASVTASAVVLAWLALRRRSVRSQGQPTALWARSCWLLLAGVVTNAAVCAALASPLDRFQARIVWLLPLLAAAGVAALRAQGRPVAGRPGPPTSWAHARQPQGSPR